MKTLLISASSRDGSQSHRIVEQINTRYFDDQAKSLDLFSADLPTWSGTGFSDIRVKRVRESLREADAFIFVIPEWNGMAPAAIKNLFLWFSYREFAHKPALLIAISAGEGGAFVISELRSSSYKNSRILYLPDHVILRNVESLWVKGDETQKDYFDERIRLSVEALHQYSTALESVRETLRPQFEVYANGMS